MKLTEVEPQDKPKFDQMMADFLYFSQKYDQQAFLQLFMSGVMGQVVQKFGELDDDSKSYIFAHGVQGLQKAASTMHDQLFPFGHSGQSLTEV